MKVTVDDIVRAVCAEFAIEKRVMLSDTRERRIARPRQIAMSLCREMTKKSLPAIGRYFHRDHTTVLYADQEMPRLRAIMGERIERVITAIREGESARMERAWRAQIAVYSAADGKHDTNDMAAP